MMKIYSFPYSLPSYRARLAASIMGFDFEVEEVDISTGQQKQTEYLAINPMGKVPALKDDSLVVSDSLAILRYLARKHASSDWYSDAELERVAKTDSLLSMVANELFDSVEKARLIKAFKLFPETEYPNCTALAASTLSYINTLLEDSQFLVANIPTIADIAVVSTLLYADEAQILLEDYPNIIRWIGDIKQSEGFIEPTRL